MNDKFPNKRVLLNKEEMNQILDALKEALKSKNLLDENSESLITDFKVDSAPTYMFNIKLHYDECYLKSIEKNDYYDDASGKIMEAYAHYINILCESVDQKSENYEDADVTSRFCLIKHIFIRLVYLALIKKNDGLYDGIKIIEAMEILLKAMITKGLLEKKSTIDTRSSDGISDFSFKLCSGEHSLLLSNIKAYIDYVQTSQAPGGAFQKTTEYFGSIQDIIKRQFILLISKDKSAADLGDQHLNTTLTEVICKFLNLPRNTVLLSLDKLSAQIKCQIKKENKDAAVESYAVRLLDLYNETNQHKDIFEKFKKLISLTGWVLFFLGYVNIDSIKKLLEDNLEHAKFLEVNTDNIFYSERESRTKLSRYCAASPTIDMKEKISEITKLFNKCDRVKNKEFIETLKNEIENSMASINAFQAKLNIELIQDKTLTQLQQLIGTKQKIVQQFPTHVTSPTRAPIPLPTTNISNGSQHSTPIVTLPTSSVPNVTQLAPCKDIVPMQRGFFGSFFVPTITYLYDCTQEGKREDELRLAVKAGREDKVKNLIFFDKISINGRGTSNSLCSLFQGLGDSTPLMIAIKFKQFTIAQSLIDWGADVNIKDFDGKTALDYACKSKNKKMKAIHQVLSDKDAISGANLPDDSAYNISFSLGCSSSYSDDEGNFSDEIRTDGAINTKPKSPR